VKQIDAHSQDVLNRYGFDQIPFAQLQDTLKKEGYSPDAARTRDAIAHPPSSILQNVPLKDSDAYSEFAEIGRRAIAAGQVGAVILNGGMATRFGGVPKGVVPVCAERSFLDFKINQVRAVSGGQASVFLMNSFATDAATRQHLKEINLLEHVRVFHQFVSLRLNEDGSVFQADDGTPSLYAPGHGDFPYAIKASGELETFINGGGRYLTLSNVDNLGASLDPVIIGMHIAGNKPMSVELATAYKGDVGGFPAVVGNKVAIMEFFRLPQDFDPTSISVFNTNTFVFNAETLRDTPPLSWFAVKKKVDGQEVVQFERLVGQMTEFVDVSWLVVPREGSASRFLPIKLVQDIVDQQEALRAMLTAQGVL
jgi:UTP--glucose-1-phosphate uridylyltransferase